jgi:hypothetical protein
MQLDNNRYGRLTTGATIGSIQPNDPFASGTLFPSYSYPSAWDGAEDKLLEHHSGPR